MRVLFTGGESGGDLCYIEADYATVKKTDQENRDKGTYELYIEAIDWTLSAFFHDRGTPSLLLKKALTDGYLDLTPYQAQFHEYAEDSDGSSCSGDHCMDCDNTDCIYNPLHDND